MRKFLVKFYTEDNGQKIEAIKNIRTALGIGLTEAKTLIEVNNYKVATVILNGDQVAKLAGIAANFGGMNEPFLRIDSVEEYKDAGIDFSAIQPN